MKIALRTISILALILVAVFIAIWAFGLAHAFQQAGKNSDEFGRSVSTPESVTPTPTPTATLPPALPLDPPPAVEEEPAPFEPTLCPEGTVAGAVDADGNESMCGVPCNHWEDLDGDGTAETCTASLRYTVREFVAVWA